MLKNFKIENNSRGAVAILVTMLVLTFIITISLVVSRLMIQEVRISRDIVKSFKAYEAAVAGIERGSWEIKSPRTFASGGYSDNLSNGSDYTVICDKANPANHKIISSGKYLDVERQIEVFTGTNKCD